MNRHVWASDQALASLSKEPLGADLARRVVERLIKDGDKNGLWFSHRDYCGHGLMYSLGQFHLIEVYDGFADDSRLIRSWSNEESFRVWLGKQSDYSLSGADDSQPELLANTMFELNNQRLTKERMIDYVTYGRR
jgi:hypothetical protein